jgi:Arc/MetJ-type ribon-helix-helix transcriptional regulator
MEVMEHAENTTYLGALTESEVRNTVNRTVRLTRYTDAILQEMANDNRFGYQGSVSNIIRHAVEMLIKYFAEQKMMPGHIEGFVNDALRIQHEARLDADRARIRREFVENIAQHEAELDQARRIGDWEAIGRRLKRYTEMLDSCESEAQRKMLRSVLAESIPTRSAALAFAKWISDPHRVPTEEWDPDWPRLAEEWREWYLDLETT